MRRCKADKSSNVSNASKYVTQKDSIVSGGGISVNVVVGDKARADVVETVVLPRRGAQNDADRPEMEGSANSTDGE